MYLFGFVGKVIYVFYIVIFISIVEIEDLFFYLYDCDLFNFILVFIMVDEVRKFF